MHIRTAQGWRLIGGPLTRSEPLPTKWFSDALSNLRRTPQMEDTNKRDMLDLWDTGRYGEYAERGL